MGNQMEEKKEGIDAARRNREGSDAEACRGGGAKSPMKIAVSLRQQTLEEERRCNAAIQLLLAELVRQQLGCEGEK